MEEFVPREGGELAQVVPLGESGSPPWSQAGVVAPSGCVVYERKCCGGEGAQLQSLLQPDGLCEDSQSWILRGYRVSCLPQRSSFSLLAKESKQL